MYVSRYISCKLQKCIIICGPGSCTYRKVASSNTSHLEAHAGFFKLLMKGDFQSLCTVTFCQKVDFLMSNAH